MKCTTAAEAVKLIKSHHNVFIQGSVSIPEVLVQAMVDRAGELTDVNLYMAFAVADREAPYCDTKYNGIFNVNSFFLSNNIRRWINEGYANYIPAFLGEIPGLFRKGIVPIDVVLLNCSAPNKDGYVSFGISADLAYPASTVAKIKIAQINPNVPFCYGDAVLHLSELDAYVEVDEPLVTMPTVEPNELETKIGNYIAELVPDGATLQIGVGGIPNAVLEALKNHKNLGLHTEAMTDGVVPLLQSGVINNTQKKINPGKTSACLTLGSQRLYDYMDYCEELIMRDVAWTNDPQIIRQNPKVMAINSAIEVDLTGQVCSDSIGTRIYSGVGGQHDFMYGGALSEGGKTFIAIPSMTEKGQSRISALLKPGAGVVTTRFLVQHVVTEYGVAYLQGKGIAERAKELIKIAHPSVQEELEKAACERFGYSFLRLK